VVGALPEEVEPLRRRLVEETVTRLGRRLPVSWGLLEGRPTAVAATGDGWGAASAGIEMLLSSLEVERLLVLGIAGGLTLDLSPGALLLARQVVSTIPSDGTQPSTLEPRPEDLDAARRDGFDVGTAVTARSLVATPEDKAETYRRLRLEGPATVDLESAVYARAADAAELPWLVLRAVSDGIDEALPTFLPRCQDDQGRVVRSKVVRYALARPGSLPELLALRRRLTAGAHSLAEAALPLLRSWS
jgi:nucleoside phosphorylase